MLNPTIMNKIKYLTILILIISCSDKKQSIQKNGNEGGYYTFIFNGTPKPVFIPIHENTFLGGKSFFEKIAFHYNDKEIKEYLNPIRSLIDTVSVFSKKKSKEFVFFKDRLSTNSFLFNRGDTISVNYTGTKFDIKILNRKPHKNDYFYESYIDSILYSKNNISFYEMYFKYLPPPPLNLKSSEDINDFWINNRKNNGQNLLKELDGKKRIRDSLFSNNLISKNIYNYYSDKDYFIFLSYLADNKKFVLGSKKNILFNKEFKTSSTENYKSVLKTVLEEKKESLDFSFFKEFLTNYYFPKFYEEKTIKKIYSYEKSGGNFYQFDKVYDEIEKDTIFPVKIKDYLLFTYMNKIAKNLKPETTINYYQKFKDSVKNKSYPDYIRSIYKIDKEDNGKTILLNKKGKKFSLQELIRNKKPKLVYVIFEASWCFPCKQIQEDVENLKSIYKDNSITFLNISIEKDFDKWLHYVKDRSIENSFYLENYFTSNLIKENHVNFIPRFILLDSIGNIIDPEVISPKDQNINKYLNNHLKKAD
jgi:thiol-disulfide isomerase/thioredoxin